MKNSDVQLIETFKEDQLDAFQAEFGIHFKSCSGELQFALAFLEDAIDGAYKLGKKYESQKADGNNRGAFLENNEDMPREGN